jgi:hypothetical protein
LLSDVKVNDRQAIIDNNISEMLKYKILSIYLPTQYLSIFSKKYLNFFIAQFYEDPEKGKEYSEIYDK